jgi:hypothetical protein
MTLWEEIQDNLLKVEQTLSQLKRYGKELAKAESDYKIALRIEIMKLREEKKAATLVLNLCYGTPHIAKLRLDRDIADTLHRACLEGINIYKLKLRILESQYAREWGSTKS